MLHPCCFHCRSALTLGLVTLVWLVGAGTSRGARQRLLCPPFGNDAWSGRLADVNTARTDGPWQTLAKACSAARPGDTCRLRAGVYREVLQPQRSGTPAAPILFTAQHGETVVLSGADPVGSWQAAGQGLFKTTLAWDLADENQLFVGEAMLIEARWPNMRGTLLTPARAQVAAGSPNTIVDPNLPGGDEFWKGAGRCGVPVATAGTAGVPP